MRRPSRQITFYIKDDSLEKQIAHAKLLEKAKAIGKQKESEDMPTLDDSPRTTGLKQ